jgi:hypothetical protein
MTAILFMTHHLIAKRSCLWQIHFKNVSGGVNWFCDPDLFEATLLLCSTGRDSREKAQEAQKTNDKREHPNVSRPGFLLRILRLFAANPVL